MNGLYMYTPFFWYTVYRIQGDFQSCADILPCDRTPQKVTIEPIVPYANVDIFREKGGKKFFKKCLGATEFCQET
jgi:hypothetical protein